MRSESDRYEVTGKIDAARYAAMQKMSAPRQREQVSLMEQSLLADRFQLKAHVETRQMPEYALVVVKSGSQIVNKTGLQGRFNFTLKFSGSVDDAPALPTALQEQLGLRLVSENGPMEVVVIDHLERPSEN
jgi:bla regulator protein BlaR1